eukprot:TRINITY_DN50834_c0_g1_i1.p1 TRINITY_DN50834_c0_g1~~TRINITY_DN50834_c0_g1_i1.p1  ORF type:complete len:375 (+),score=95.04 TRINITY_DN50834_c0_g1_i1:79-1125(+)
MLRSLVGSEMCIRDRHRRAGITSRHLTAADATAQECVGFGKLILFGEHFVVYRVPAIVGAVSASTSCQVELSDAEWSSGLMLEDNRPAVPGYKIKKADEMLGGTLNVLRHFGVDPNKVGIKVTLGGELCAVSGIGASAAHCVSLARALARALNVSATEAEINAAGFEGEKGYHGTPSGIDNTASTYGGLLRFQRVLDSDPLFELVPIAHGGCRIVYASTGITASTTEVVGDVADRRQSDPAWYNSLEREYTGEVLPIAEKALKEGDWGALGRAAGMNHRLLQQLGVSCPELDSLVDTALEAGALGAKMAGTGRGGLMFAVCGDSSEAQEAVFRALSGVAPQVWKTSFV